MHMCKRKTVIIGQIISINVVFVLVIKVDINFNDQFRALF